MIKTDKTEEVCASIDANIFSYNLNAFEGGVNTPYLDSYNTAMQEVGFMENAIDGDNALRLIGLICKLTQAAQLKQPDARPIHLLVKACGKPVTPGAQKDYKKISVMCDLFLVPNTKFSDYGFTDVDSMLKEIVRIMDMWLPF